MEYDISDAPQGKQIQVSVVLVSPPRRLVNCTIEISTFGDASRALARAYLRETEPNVFSISPFYLREISGPDVPWQWPEPGSVIQTISPITNFDQAHDALTWWATQTFAANRRL